MTTITTYRIFPSMAYGKPGHADAQAAADAINKTLFDSGEASFDSGDALGYETTQRAIDRELGECDPDVRAGLVVQAHTEVIDD